MYIQEMCKLIIPMKEHRTKFVLYCVLNLRPSIPWVAHKHSFGGELK